MPALPIPNSASSRRQTPEQPLSNAFTSSTYYTRNSHPSQPPPNLPPSNNNFGGIIARSLDERDTYFALPASYLGLDAGPAPGTVVGITLGSVLGFLLLLWLVQSLANTRSGPARYVEGDASEIVVTRRSRGDERSAKRSRKARTRRTARSDGSSQSSVGPPPGLPRGGSPRRRTERIIVEETRRTESRPAAPLMTERVVERETVIEERGGGRRVDGDDVVEVIEEHSDVSGPSPGRRKKAGRSGTYRNVDPGLYGGGNYPPNEYRRSSRTR